MVSSPCSRSAASTCALDQSVQRAQRRRASADLVGERRQAQIDPFSRVALALPVQRLMLAELLEQDHRQQVRPGEAARRHMERRRRLRDRLALAAREPLAHRLDHLPLAGTTSSVSVTSSPSFDSLAEPQHGQLAGAAITTRSRGRCSGNGFRTGRRRSNDLTSSTARNVPPPARPRSRRPRRPPTAFPVGRAGAACVPSARRRARGAASRSPA